ncbi:hypothetical protein ACFL0L_05420 [Patescibacteria group bacterium]
MEEQVQQPQQEKKQIGKVPYTKRAIIISFVLASLIMIPLFISTITIPASPDTGIHGQADQSIIEKLIAKHKWQERVLSWDTERGRIYLSIMTSPDSICYSYVGDSLREYFNAKGQFIADCRNGYERGKIEECDWLKGLSSTEPDYTNYGHCDVVL